MRKLDRRRATASSESSQLELPRLFQTHGGEVKIRAIYSSLCEPLAARSPLCSSAQASVNYWRAHISRAPWYDDQREMAVVLCVDTQYAILSFSLISIGTLNETIVHARDVFRPAIATNAFAVVVMHNHPSGSLKPGAVDAALTKRLIAWGDDLRIPLLDHVIVAAGTRKYFSFLEAGVVPEREPVGDFALILECPSSEARK